MALYTRSENLRLIAQTCMEEFDDLAHLDDPGCRIAYQYCDQEKQNKGKVVFADTEVIKEKLREYCPYEFLITFYEPNCQGLDDEHLKRLMYHELKHVGWDGDNKFGINPHDYEDFQACIDKWGPDWLTDEELAEC